MRKNSPLQKVDVVLRRIKQPLSGSSCFSLGGGGGIGTLGVRKREEVTKLSLERNFFLPLAWSSSIPFCLFSLHHVSVKLCRTVLYSFGINLYSLNAVTVSYYFYGSCEDNDFDGNIHSLKV